MRALAAAITSVGLSLFLLATGVQPAAAGPSSSGGYIDRYVYVPGNFWPGYSSGCSYPISDPTQYSTADVTDHYGQVASDEAVAQGLSPQVEAVKRNGEWVWEVEGPQGMQWWYASRKCGSDISNVWITNASPANFRPVLWDYLRAELPIPEAEFLPVDANHGWLYTQVPTDFRLDDDEWENIRVIVRAGPYEAWVTATHRELLFTPGDPRRPNPVSCVNPEAPYQPTTPGDCHYTYLNASSIASGSDQFTYEFRTVWDVTYGGNAPGAIPPDEVTSTEFSDSIAVAEARPSS